MKNRLVSLNDTHYKWYLLGLAALSCSVVVAAPAMSLSVLFKEISSDLHLNLVQVGLVWGIGALPGIFTGILAGVIGDRFGPRRILILGTALAGLASALRGFSFDFISLVASVSLLGGLTPLVMMNAFKTCGIWFPSHKLGLANGVISMGMALGFLLSSMFSATVLSPWLGGWRHVLFFYGALAVVFSIFWYFTRSAPVAHPHTTGGTQFLSMRQTMLYMAKIRNVWLLGLTLFGVGGCIQGLLGYLPLYLRGIGWQAIQADGALAAFHTISLVSVIPISIWSDRFGSRKKVLFGAAWMLMAGVGLLSFADGLLIWGAVLIAGMVRDGFMANYMTMVIETDGVGPLYAGTATGFTMIFSGLGNLLSPPIGNSLASIAPGAPFAFWAALAAMGIICLSQVSTKPAVPDL